MRFHQASAGGMEDLDPMGSAKESLWRGYSKCAIWKALDSIRGAKGGVMWPLVDRRIDLSGTGKLDCRFVQAWRGSCLNFMGGTPYEKDTSFILFIALVVTGNRAAVWLFHPVDQS